MATVNFNASVHLKKVNLSLDTKKRDFLSYGSPLLYKFQVPVEESGKFRIQVSRSDLASLREEAKEEKGCSSVVSPQTCFCSIVAIQNLDYPFSLIESDITFKSRWQNMIGLSVIDIEVDTLNDDAFQRGFYVVVLKRETDFL